MPKPRILVIGGGPSPERDIALLSSKAVFDAVDKELYEVVFYDWDGSSQWLDAHLKSFDLVLPILHGVGGEDGTIQRVLEAAKVPFLGSGSEVSALCFDKQQTRQKMQQLGVRTPAGDTITFAQYKSHELTQGPHVLKPINGGSSIDTYIITDDHDSSIEAIAESFRTHGTMLLEQYISGIEITVPVLGENLLPTIEIQPPENGTFDYINKYNGKTREICPPENISENEQRIANQCARTIFNGVGCRHLARIDMIVHQGDVYVLEVNTIPGLTSQSLYPKAAAEAGLSFEQLVERFITMVSSITV